MNVKTHKSLSYLLKIDFIPRKSPCMVNVAIEMIKFSSKENPMKKSLKFLQNGELFLILFIVLEIINFQE